MKNADGSNNWKKCGSEKQKTGPGRKKSADNKRRSGPGERPKKRLWSSECHRGSCRPFLFSLATTRTVLGQQGLNTVALVIRVMAQGFSLSNVNQKGFKHTARSCWLELTGIAEIVLWAYWLKVFISGKALTFRAFLKIMEEISYLLFPISSQNNLHTFFIIMAVSGVGFSYVPEMAFEYFCSIF